MTNINDLLDNMIVDGSASEISNDIEEILYSKIANKVDQLEPEIASTFFDDEIEEATERPTKDDLKAVQNMSISQSEREKRNKQAMRDMYDNPKSQKYGRDVTLQTVNRI